MPPTIDKACKIPMDAAELCITAVTTVPTITPKIGFVNAVNICVN